MGVFKEERPTLLETLSFLRKKFKMWPQTLKFHSLENAKQDETEHEDTTPIV